MDHPLIKWIFELSPSQVRLLESLLVILFFVALRSAIMRIVGTRIKDLRSRLAWRQTVTISFLLLGMVLLIHIWFEWFQSIFTLLSVIAAALVIVSKELILNFTSAGVILWRGLFEVGDRIEVGKTTGDVVEIGLFYITLAEVGTDTSSDEATGRIVKVPNSLVLATEVFNFSRGLELIWHEISVQIRADKNWQRAREIAQEVIAETTVQLTDSQRRKLLKSSEEIMFTSQRSKVYLRMQGDKVLLNLRYLCKIHKRRATEHQIWEAMLTRFAEEGDILASAKNDDDEA